MRSVIVEQVAIVEKRVDQIDVVLERVDQTRVDDFQDHSHHVFDRAQILHVGIRQFVVRRRDSSDFFASNRLLLQKIQ